MSRTRHRIVRRGFIPQSIQQDGEDVVVQAGSIRTRLPDAEWRRQFGHKPKTEGEARARLVRLRKEKRVLQIKGLGRETRRPTKEGGRGMLKVMLTGLNMEMDRRVAIGVEIDEKFKGVVKAKSAGKSEMTLLFLELRRAQEKDALRIVDEILNNTPGLERSEDFKWDFGDK